MKILALDIETKPATVYTWTLWQPTIGIDQIIDAGGIMCYVAKWLGQRKTIFRSDHHDGHENMIASLWELLDEADAVLHFNGTSFDVPHIQREFMENGLTPPSPFKQIDLYKTVKRQGRFLSNKLAFVAPQLGLESKHDTGGFKLWKACIAGDEKAWKTMRRYNRRDVTLLEDAYNILRPWIPGHPNANLYNGNGCPKCGSSNTQRRGYATLATGRYQRLHCTDCGTWARETKRVETTKIVAIS